MKKISLKWRFTILTAFILTIICVLISAVSIYTVQSQFIHNFNYPIEAVPIIPMTEATQITPSLKLEESLAVSRSNFNQEIIIFTVLVIIVGSAIMYFVSDIFLKPIRELSDNIKKFRTDDLSQRLSHEGANDEIKILSTSFNEMIDTIEQGFLREKRFSTNIAHELKTPLTTMKINIDVFNMSEDYSKETTENLVEVIGKQNIRMIELVEDLLSFAHSSEIDNEKPVPLEPLIAEILSDVNSQLTSKSIMVETNLSSIELKGSVSLLKNAVSNIVSNAIKYNIDGGMIEIFTDNENLLHIKDSGIGIDECHLEKIFDPLYRVNESRNRDIAGVGLGLALTKEIIKNHNGTIIAESDGKTYSEFIINLPKFT